MCSSDLVDLRDQLSRTLQVGAFPALVREIPELRPILLRGRVQLGRGRLPLYAGAVALASRRPRLAAALGTAWLTGHWYRASAAEPSLRRRLKAVPILVVSDALAAGALVAGSVRARRLVL